MIVHPLQDKVLLSEDKNRATSSGIIVEGLSGGSKTYTVDAVGPDVKKIQVGNVVYPDLTKCMVVISDGKHLALISEEHIAAVITL